MCQSSFGTNKPCMSTLHIFISDACVRVKREDSCLFIRIYQQLSQDVLHDRGYFRKRMDLFEISQKQPWTYFCLKLEIHPELRHFEFDVTLTAICETTGTINFKLVLTILKWKGQPFINYIRLAQSLTRSDYLIWSLHYWTWHLAGRLTVRV